MTISGRGTGRGTGAALCLLLLLLTPVALADHVYSHRLYVVGRVIDVDGRPAAGVPLNVSFDGMSADGRCFDSKPEVTGPRGDFEICRHAHVIPTGVNVTVSVGNASRTARVDPDLRMASVRLQLDQPSTHDLAGERQFARTFSVVGRAFALLPRPYNEEAVMVNATPIFSNVTVELRVLDRVLAEQEVAPDLYGIYRAELAIEEIPAAAIVRARVGSDIGEDVASSAFRRTDVNIVRDLRLAEGQPDDAPGSKTPFPLGYVALAALIGASIARRARRAG